MPKRAASSDDEPEGEPAAPRPRTRQCQSTSAETGSCIPPQAYADNPDSHAGDTGTEPSNPSLTHDELIEAARATEAVCKHDAQLAAEAEEEAMRKLVELEMGVPLHTGNGMGVPGEAICN